MKQMWEWFWPGLFVIFRRQPVSFRTQIRFLVTLHIFVSVSGADWLWCFVRAPVSPKIEATPIAVPDGWNLIWHDEFDGKAIDTQNWTYDLGAGGWGNGEAQYYTSRPENARLENGTLVIEARQEKYEDSYYTSARLKTQGLQNFQYGRIEARLKVPSGKGLWPAFWMLGSSFMAATGLTAEKSTSWNTSAKSPI
jgi:beta-glucanase (GH16 family)